MSDVQSADINIRPQLGQPQRYADIGMAQLFQAHVSIVNSERQTIWARYSALVLANSFLLGYFRPDIKTEDIKISLIVDAFGIALCAIWFAMTWLGWRAFYDAEEFASKFRWTHHSQELNPLRNPFRTRPERTFVWSWRNPFRTRPERTFVWSWRRALEDKIFVFAVLTIFVFVGIYLAILISLWRKL